MTHDKPASNTGTWKEVLGVIVGFMAIFLVYADQTRISLNNGQGFDGPFYYRIAEEILTGNFPVPGEVPYVQRIGACLVPAWISMITGMDLLDGAMWSNLIATLLTAILLVVWLREMVGSPYVRLLLVLLFLMNFRVTLRSAFWYPMVTDGWGSFFLVAGLLCLGGMVRAYDQGARSRLFWHTMGLSLVMAVGTMFRETHALFALVALFVARPVSVVRGMEGRGSSWSRLWALYTGRPGRILLIPAVMLVPTKLLIGWIIAPRYNLDYTYVSAMVEWIWTKSLPMVLLSIFIATGPVLLLALVPPGVGAWVHRLRGREDLWSILLMAVLFGWIGGNDSERIFFVAGFPVLLGMVGAAMEAAWSTRARWWLVILLLLQTVAHRYWWPIPDSMADGAVGQRIVPVLTIPGTRFDALMLHSFFGNMYVNMIVFAEYMALLIITWLVMQRYANALGAR